MTEFEPLEKRSGGNDSAISDFLERLYLLARRSKKEMLLNNPVGVEDCERDVSESCVAFMRQMTTSPEMMIGVLEMYVELVKNRTGWNDEEILEEIAIKQSDHVE